MEFVRAGGIDADLSPPGGPTPETLAMVREADEMLALESAQWRHQVAAEVRLAMDVLSVLFGAVR